MDMIEKIKDFNELEYTIYFYMIQNKNQILKMKLKDLANILHVSSAMITRVCQKMGYEGFGEYKAFLKLDDSHKKVIQESQLEYILDYFHRVDSEAFKNKIQKACDMIRSHEDVLFFGIGLSSVLANYGALLLNRVGVKTTHISDFSMRMEGIYNNAIAIILSVSGETKEIYTQTMNMKQNGIEVIVICDKENSQAALLADLAIGYYLPNTKDQYLHNSVTQVPVMYILESIASYLQ